MASAVWLIFKSMAHVEVRLPDNLNHRRLIDCQFSCGAGVNGKSRVRPTKNRCPNLTPLLFRRYFTNHNPRFVAGRICKRDMKTFTLRNTGGRSSETIMVTLAGWAVFSIARVRAVATRPTVA